MFRTQCTAVVVLVHDVLTMTFAQTYRRLKHCEVWVVHSVCRTCSVPTAQTFRWSCCQGSPSPVQEMAEPLWGVSGQATDWGQVWCQVRTNTWQRAEIPGRVTGTGGMYCVLAVHPDPRKLALKGHIPLSTIASRLQPDVACRQQTPDGKGIVGNCPHWMAKWQQQKRQHLQHYYPVRARTKERGLWHHHSSDNNTDNAKKICNKKIKKLHLNIKI